MANDPKADQSVMISFDELDDIGADAPEEPEETREALSQLGVNKTTGGHRPVPSGRQVHVQQLKINEPKKSNALLYIMLGLCAVGLVAGGVVLGGHLNPGAQLFPSKPSGQETQQSAATTAPPPSDAVKALLAEDQAKEEAEAQAKLEAEAQAKAKEAAERAKAEAKRAQAEAEAKYLAAKAKTKAKRSASQESKKDSESKKESEKEVAPPKPEPKKSEAASLLSSLKKGKGDSGSSSSATSTKSDLPSRLGRSDILNTVRKNQSGINQCKSKLNAGDSRVRVLIRLKIEKSGSVSSVDFLSPDNYKGTPLESCMKERVKRFKFPAFNGSTMSIKLPFIL